MQIISKEECLILVGSHKPYHKVSVVHGVETEGRSKYDIPNLIEVSTEIYTDAYVADKYITVDIHFEENGTSKIARVLLI